MEEVQEAIRTDALDNMVSLVAAYNSHLLRPLKGGCNSLFKFSTSDNNREIIYYPEMLMMMMMMMMMSFSQWEFNKENMLPKAEQQQWLDAWEDPAQWMEVAKQLNRRIFTNAELSKVGSDEFRSSWNAEERNVPRALWSSVENERQCDPAMEKAEKMNITEELDQRYKDLKGWVSVQIDQEIYTEGIRVYTNLMRVRREENEMLETVYEQTEENLAKRVASKISPHPPVLLTLCWDPDVANQTIHSSLSQFGAPFSVEHGSVVTKMVSWIEGQPNKCASVEHLIGQFSLNGERTKV